MSVSTLRRAGGGAISACDYVASGEAANVPDPPKVRWCRLTKGCFWSDGAWFKSLKLKYDELL